ncbi:hypothetical protein JTE90_019592 [Oedothorax gibbosus]|uniref:Carboxylesterase type B domain-containing protein n=1 Tax=Oedothorax gibbosus TaxID=931172 RepID=A0AAV6V629_9ARAC|nr:hypothetical protein JTE90_019592 [Oedothorax gibbosus]
MPVAQLPRRRNSLDQQHTQATELQQMGRQPLRLPVMAFIHGESYEWNGGNPYDARVLSSYGNVIVVTINYRLGVLGFLPSVDRSSRGNYGLMDQVAALHWIQDNIAEFGGDPNNVTVFGHGHGAACVNLLMLSPMAKGLFQRVILQSGSALCPWALAKDAASHARKLAQSMNCSTRDSTKLIDCLRKKRLEDIMSVDIQAPDHLSAFGPTVDGIVLPKSPMYLMQTKPDLFLRYDMMFGVTKVESYFGYSSVEEVGGIDGRKRDMVLRTLVRNLYNRHLQQIFLTVVNEYMDWSLPYLHPTDIFRGTVEAVGDVTVLSPMLRTGTFHSNPVFPADKPPHHNPRFFLPTKTYFYVFTHQTEGGDYLTRLGGITGEDLAYVFGAPLVTSLAHFGDNYTSEEEALSEMVMSHWTSFAKFGDPNIGSQLGEMQIDATRGRFERVVWPEFTANHQKYLSISPKPKVKDHYNAHKLSYWLNLIPKLNAVDNTTTEQHHMLDDHHNKSSYDGCVRDLYKNVQQVSNVQESSGNGSRDGNSSLSSTSNSTGVQVYGLDQGTHLSALGLTIAVGCSLLMLNAVVFAAIFYQKDKINVAKNVQKAYYEIEKSNQDDEEDDSFKKPYLLKDAPSSLILHEFDTLRGYKDSGGGGSVFDLVVESSDIKRPLGEAVETELITRHHSTKTKTVTFVEPPTVFCEIPDPPDCKCAEQIAFIKQHGKEPEMDTNS